MSLPRLLRCYRGKEAGQQFSSLGDHSWAPYLFARIVHHSILDSNGHAFLTSLIRRFRIIVRICYQTTYKSRTCLQAADDEIIHGTHLGNKLDSCEDRSE